MNMSFVKYPVLLLASALSLYGCVREELSEAGNGDMRIRIGARVDAVQVSVKSAIDYDDQVADMPIDLIRWDENTGGQSVVGRTGLAATMSGSTSDGTREITFDEAQFYLNRTDAVGFAGWYPSASSSQAGGDGWELQNGNVIHSDATMVYNLWRDGRLDVETDVMVSDFVQGSYSTSILSLEFRHALCMFNFYVYAVDTDTKAEWGDLTKVSLANLPDQLIVTLPEDVTEFGNATFGYSDSSQEQPYVLWNDEANPMELPVGLPTMSQDAYVGTVLAGAPVKNVLGIFAKTKNQSENSVSISRDFQPGYTYNIFLRFSTKGIINAEVSVSDWDYVKNDYVIDDNFELLTDLSRYGTSNSYIVSSANRGYCFTGTVKGNGDEGNVFTGRAGTTIQLDASGVNLNVDHIGIVRSDAMLRKLADDEDESVPSGATVINENGSRWVMQNNDDRYKTDMIELVSDQLSDGRVIFRVLGAEDKSDYSLQYKGNVKIAAFDASDNIIWSWHIWITDKPLNQGYQNGYVALDRNLGAVTKDYTSYQQGMSPWSGMYYQWGRKDPIFRATVEGNNPWNPDQADAVSTPATMTEVTRNPVTYYYDGTGGNSWLSSSDPGYANFDHFWGYISVRDDIVKTIYDPCPPGYRVPGNALWEDPDPAMTNERLVNSSGEFAGYRFTIDDMISIYYPGTSAIVSDNGAVTIKNNDRVTGTTGAGNFVFMNSATPYEPSSSETGSEYQDRAYHFRYSNVGTGVDYESVMVAGTDYHAKRSDAYPVRCVFEDSAPVITDLSETQTANCYVVSQTGYYEFDATVRGNGVTALNIVSGDTYVYRQFDAGMGSTISGIDHVGVLWWQGSLLPGSWWRDFVDRSPSDTEISANCPVTVLDGGRLVDGKPLLYVRANENTYGNVGLAAYDANGNILWTWHIWIQPEISTVSLGDYTLMDRNLGATYCPGSGESFNANNIFAGLGFYYQWGRKDPFFQPASLSETGTGTQTWLEKEADGTWTIHESNAIESRNTIPMSVQNPLVFYMSPSENAWQTSYQSGNGAINDLWGYVGANGDAGNSFAKTMYDPCPPGYRVMQHNVFLTANICAADHAVQFSFSNDNDNWVYFYTGQETRQETLESDFGGYEGRILEVRSGGIWFPNSGAINSAGSFSLGSNNRLATATPFSGTSMREIRWWDNGSRYRIQQYSSSYMADGLVVRCQME